MEKQLKMKPVIKFSLFSGLQQRSLPVVKHVISFFLLACVFSNPTYADVQSITANPTSISAAGTASFTINWRITRLEATSPPPPVIVSSSSAILEINGVSVATVAGLISTPSSFTTGSVGTVNISDRITINAALARRIAESPAGSVRIRRFFDDTQNGILGFAQLFAGNGNSGPLTIRRIDLAFENQARTDVVYKDEHIRAFVDISFRSSGILKGEWRLVDPTASLGSTGGRVLQVVQKNLRSSGEGRTRIISPPLPTNENGLYLLTFFVQGSDSALDTPVIRYFVLDKNGIPPLAHVTEINIISPADNAPITRKTLFSWPQLEGATAYQVEVFNKDDSVAISGKLVPASRTNLSLSSFSLHQLLSGYNYHWKVRAFNHNGQIIGESEPRTLSVP